MLQACLYFFVTQIVFGQVLSEVVGSIDTMAITSRDVRVDYIVESILYRKEVKPLNDTVTSAEFDRELNRLLMENVVYTESKLFKIVDIGNDSVKSSQTKFLNLLSKNKQFTDRWRSLDVASSELAKILERKLQAKGFIEFKARASLIPVTEAEAFDYYKNNRKKFGSKPYKDFKDSIKNVLAKQQADTRLSEWFGVLKKKYQVRKVYLTKSN